MAKSGASPKPIRRAAKVAVRAFGRSLGDFDSLSAAEEKVRECCRRGEMAIIAEEIPDEESDANRVRAGFIRFLALGGDETVPVHERGVRLQGAWITGVLSLDGATVERRLGLWRCRIEGIEARQTSLKSLNLSGSRLVGGFVGGRLCCGGGIFLRHGFHCTGEIDLLGATIDGSIDCTGGRFDNGDGDVLSCDGASISGDVFLSDNFHATGHVRLLGVTIAGDLECNGARFENEAGPALSCDNAQVKGNLFFRNLAGVEGYINLSAMHVGSLCDDLESWEAARGRLVIDGFTYDRLAGTMPVDAAKRIAWLDMQSPYFLGEGFRPQPWEQAIAVLRAMGHTDEARTLAIAKHERMHRAGRYVGGSLIWDSIYGALVGYGYRLSRLLWTLLGIWLFCALAYWAAVRPTATGSGTYYLGPPRSEPNAACLVQRAAARSALPCVPQPPRYGDFFALTYSLEAMLPVINLGGKERWQPVVSDQQGRPLYLGHALRVLYWLQTALGWLAGLLLIGVVGTLIKKD